MPVQKAPHWTELYYDIVAHYFWKPQNIGRKSDPKRAGPKWGYWKQKLESQETPLNHILDLLFYMAPQDLLDRIASALLRRPVSRLELVQATHDVVNPNIVQPDIILMNDAELVFIEMKVDSRSIIDQYAKYAISALCMRRVLPMIERVDLVILSRHLEHEKVWRGGKRLGLKSDTVVRRVAVEGILEKDDPWKESGVQSFLARHPEDREALAKEADSMGLLLANYPMMASILDQYKAITPGLAPFIDGVLHELRKRKLF